MTLERLYKWECTGPFGNVWYLYTRDTEDALIYLIKSIEVDEACYSFQLTSIHPIYIPSEWIYEQVLFDEYIVYYKQ